MSAVQALEYYLRLILSAAVKKKEKFFLALCLAGIIFFNG